MTATQKAEALTTAILRHPLRQRTGGILPFKKYAVAKGIDASDKDQRKALMAEYNGLKVEFYRINRKALGLAASDPTHNITKFRILDNGGWDASGRMPTAASQKATKSAELAQKDAVIAEMQRELEALRALVKPAQA